MEQVMNKITAYLFLALAIIGVVGALFFGAWWHLATAGFCFALFRMFKAEE